jgi:uncharacterized protein
MVLQTSELSSGADSKSGARPRTPLASSVLLALIATYRNLFAPFLGGFCRYVPSCSLYAEEAVRRYGAVTGARLAVQRVSRCHPFHHGGFDPVP